MLATSIRQPSARYGSASHLATTESSPSMKRRRSSSELQSNLGSDGTPSHDSYSS